MSTDPYNPKYANRHQILRNLKWFVKQFCTIFEETLQSKLYKAKLVPISAAPDSPPDNRRLPPCSHPKLCSPYRHAASIQTPSWCRSLTNSPIMRRFTPARSSRGSTPVKKPSVPLKHMKCDDLQLARLLVVCSQTNESDRAEQVRQFAQHVAVIYEYQIGMLRSIGAVMEVVKFVAELIVKAIRMNYITELNSRQLNPTIFFLNIPLPKSGSKIVKTLQLGPGTEFSWRVCDIFCRSGLRHNRVGGQDCSNLTISTHFHATSGSTAYSYRPDVYGYRNIIAIENSEHIPDQSEEAVRLYQLSKLDLDTLDRPSDTGSLVGRDLAEQCMDHWHKCYKSMFFLICDRWEIVDHLENCDSFRVFCTREKICPVMQISTVPDVFTYQGIASLIQHFDVFSISSDSPLVQEENNRTDKTFRSNGGKNEQFEAFDGGDFVAKVYDNAAFVC